MAQNAAAFLSEHYGDDLDQIIRLTALNGCEHGFMVVGDGDTHARTTPLQAGDADGMASSDVPEIRVAIDVHTHPHPPIAFSAADWRHFAREFGQYPEGAFSEGGLRAFVVVGQTPANTSDGAYMVRAWQMTDGGLSMDKDRQHDLAGDVAEWSMERERNPNKIFEERPPDIYGGAIRKTEVTREMPE